METNQLQQELFSYLKTQLPPHLSLVDELGDLLDLSPDSVYRRIRGEKPITLNELKRICEKYNLSIDQMLKLENESVLFKSLSGSKLGIWVAHGEGKFQLPKGEKNYNIVAKYTYADYPANPNGSDFSVAGICSADGRHLAMMPHLERAMFPWQCGYYPEDRRNSDEVTPWIEGFVNARKWIEEHKK